VLSVEWYVYTVLEKKDAKSIFILATYYKTP